MKKLYKAYRKWSVLTRLTNTILLEEENRRKSISKEEWKKVNYWLERSKKTMKACRKILEI